MYGSCTFCYGALGSNPVLEAFPVSRRVAFDPAKGCIWAVCPRCARWNLAPIEERWEAVEECERLFRGTTLRYSSGNIGIAHIADRMDLIRVGRAMRPEVAAWRYGRLLARPRSLRTQIMERAGAALTRAVAAVAGRRATHSAPAMDARALASRVLVSLRGSRVLDLVHVGSPVRAEGLHVPLAVVRYRHLAGASLVRPEAGQPWALLIPHDHGMLAIEGESGLRTAARLLAIVNRTEHAGGFPPDLVEQAVRKVDESAQSDSYFNRVLAIALRSNWGRGETGEGSGSSSVTSLEHAHSDMERMAWRLTGRTFWGHGGIGSLPSAALLDIPLVDRVALEMAAHEESERRALDGELATLYAAWREADEIATIADALIPQ
ncbi:MAG: hypothetical protein ABIZ91_09520 [Gemmatimonadaceae bacterium]